MFKIAYGKLDIFSQSSYQKSPPPIERLVRPESIKSNGSTQLTPHVHINRNIEFKTDDAFEDNQNEDWVELKKRNLTLQSKLEVALKNVEDLKYMLVESYSEGKRKKRDLWDEHVKVKKVCREVIWRDVKFAPDSAYVQFGDNSIFKTVVNNCNLPEGLDEIVFWGNNRDVVKSSLNEHRSNVTSRIKRRFKAGKCFTY